MFILNSRFLTQNLTGVQRYGFELFKQINKLTDNVVNVLPDQQINERYNLQGNITLHKTGKNRSHIWEQLDLPAYLNKAANKPLLLNLCNTAPLFYKNQIVTVHDVAYLRGNWHSRSFRAFYKFAIPLVLKNSRHVITVSEFSKQELISTYQVPHDKISVVYNAPFFPENALTNAGDNLTLKSPFILSVGSVDRRKNVKSLIKAFLNSKQANLTLYLIGGYNANFRTDPELDTLLSQNADRIIFLGYRTDEELIYLYQNALCFVYPSLYEGFGLPPIEAMANGCPVITSNGSCLPEICGDGALFCDPLNINDIAEKIDTIAQNDEIRAQLIVKGKKNAEKYSWEASGREMMSILNRFL